MWKAIILLLCGSGLSVEAGLTKLQAISMVESGNNDYAVGGAGEISRYQIKPKVWRQYSRSTAYANTRVSSWVAEQHLQYLERQFKSNTGREPTDFDRYVMWNGGFPYYARIHFSPRAVKLVIRERARRYANLREEPVELARETKPALHSKVFPAAAVFQAHQLLAVSR